MLKAVIVELEESRTNFIETINKLGGIGSLEFAVVVMLEAEGHSVSVFDGNCDGTIAVLVTQLFFTDEEGNLQGLGAILKELASVSTNL